MYNHGTGTQPLPNNSQYKCYDGMHNWNQLQPAPYDGMYQFPSVTGMKSDDRKAHRNELHDLYAKSASQIRPIGSRPAHAAPRQVRGRNDRASGLRTGEGRGQEHPDRRHLHRAGDAAVRRLGQHLHPARPGRGRRHLQPQQPPESDHGSGSLPRHEGDTGSIETFWPCVGQARIVPDYISLFPGSGKNAPFAGATRKLCDRKEVTLDDQMSVLAKFYVFTSTHVAAHFTGLITDDFTSEFDPFSPQFGEKFSPANLPVSVKDWAGNEISRVYADQWGAYNGLNYSTWE